MRRLSENLHMTRYPKIDEREIHVTANMHGVISLYVDVPVYKDFLFLYELDLFLFLFFRINP